MARVKPITIYDVARLADVSTSTVSRVINGKRVDEAMTRRVQQAIRDTGFQPNQLARGLYTQQSRMLGCVLPDISNPFFATLFMTIERQALDHGYTLLLSNSLDDLKVEAQNLRIMSERQVDAIILTGGRINEIDPEPALLADTERIQQRTPLVMVNGELPGIECARVQVDEVQGVREVARHLLGLGHRRLAMLGGLANVRATGQKRTALQEELDRVGAGPCWFYDSAYTLQDGAQAMRTMLELPPGERPTAVLGINDPVAVGAAHAAIAAGLRIPHDLSVTGFDDTPLAAVFSPPLTTVSHRYEELAALVLKAAFKAIEGCPQHYTLPPRLVVRASTAPPRLVAQP
jgi:LacI family transcriptional regulator